MDASLRELLSLDGSVALVTGGATGIGEGIARLFARAGAVLIGDIDDEGAEKVAAEIVEAAGRGAEACTSTSPTTGRRGSGIGACRLAVGSTCS